MIGAAAWLALLFAQAPEPSGGLRRLDYDAPVQAPKAKPKPKPKPVDGGKGKPRPKRPPNVIGADGRNIIGDDDRLPAQMAARYRPEIGAADPRQAFARFGVCTATHVGRGYFLTAGHCITEEPGFQGFRSAPCPAPLALFDGRKLGCRVVTFAYDRNHDHALVRIDDLEVAQTLPAIPVDYGYDWRRRRRRDVMLYGLSKGILRVNESCVARYQSSRKRILHDCDTEGGDSGAAIIDRRTQHIIAVHGGALPRTNYGWPLEQVPWAETLCIAVGASERLPIRPGGPPVRLRVSTSKMDGDYTRLMIDLDGRLYKPDLELRVRAPRADITVPSKDVRWWGTRRWFWNDVFILDDTRQGPWSVAVGARERPRSKRAGYVRGRIWVCP